MTGRRGGLSVLLAVALLVLTGAKAPVDHSPTLSVTDYAQVISREDREEIAAIASQLESRTGAQLAVLAVPSLGGEDIESYALSVAEGWGLGGKGEDNGVLVLLALEERQSRVEVGYGLEGTLTDAATGRIQDTYMLPRFQQGDYSGGLRDGAAALASLVYTHYDVEVPDTLPKAPLAQEEGELGGAVLGGLILLLLLFSILGRRSGMGFLPLLFFPRGGGRSGGFGGSTGRGGRFGGGGSSRRF